METGAGFGRVVFQRIEFIDEQRLSDAILRDENNSGRDCARDRSRHW